MTKVLIEKWFGVGGVSIICFPVESEYVVLNQILADLEKESLVLIHSKPFNNKSEQMTLIDATGYEPTARDSLRQRVRDYDTSNFIENPGDVQGVVNRLGKLSDSVQVKWWLWWSPSDMVAHTVTDEEISRCLRIVTKDFSKHKFLAFIAKDVHTQRGLGILKYISNVFVDVTQESASGAKHHRWHLLKHPNMKLEGDSVEI